VTEPTAAEDLVLIKDALIIVGSFLPFFSDEKLKVDRATRADAVRQEAFDALDRIATQFMLPPIPRVVSRERMRG